MYRISFVLGSILLLSAFPFVANGYDWNPLPDTGQTNCYDVTGKVIACPTEGQALHGQDAQYGLKTQKFQDNGNGTVTDQNSNLMWQQQTDGHVSWQGARDYCTALGLGGYNDWSLPEKFVLLSIVDSGRFGSSINPVFSSRSSHYWTATTSANNSDNASFVNFYYGYDDAKHKSNSYYVRCVRANR